MKRFARFLVLALLTFFGWRLLPCHAGDPSRPSVIPGQDSMSPVYSSGVSYYPGFFSPPSMLPGTAASKESNDITLQPLAGPNQPSAPGAPATVATFRQPVPPPEAGPETVPAPPPGAPGSYPAGASISRGEVNLQPAPLEASDVGFPITLATALRLADARPLVVSAAQASAWVAEAQLQKAKVLWIPTFNAGGDYIRHDGYGPDFNLGINTAARPLAQSVNFLYSGIGFTQDVAMADAIFQPLAARQTLNAKRFEIQTAKNDALLATAHAYFNVHQYRGQYAGTLDVVQRGQKLVERIGFLSQDLVPRVEVDRARRMLADIEQHAASARQMWRVSSADLTQTLRLDPRMIIVPAEHDHLQVTLIEPNRPLDELIPIGLTNRPELASQQRVVQAVANYIRREKGRVLMPSLMLNGFQTPNELIEMGVQGFGHGSALNLWGLRDDVSPQVMWQLDAMGMGNMARIKEQRGEQSKAIIEVFRVQDGIAGDITRAQARLQSAAVRVVQAERSMREALITYEGNFEGLAQTKRFENVLVQVYRPQEVVIALEHLMVAYDQYFSTVADYNRAEFEMFHALGYPAREVSAMRVIGEVAPVNTSRPGYLPPVGVGPPPASR